MADLSNLKKLRPCGRLETYSTARHHLGFYKNVGFTAEYVASKNPQSSLELRIYTALRTVIAQHPVLTTITLNEDQSYPNVYFAQLPEIDLRTCVEICERKTPFPNDGEADEELDRYLVQQHSRDFKDNLGSKPFWRLLVLTSPQDTSKFTATWMWHHALADGTSAFSFHKSFLAGLNTPEGIADAIVKSSSADLAPPLEDLHPMTITWPYFIKAILGALLPSVFAKRPPKLWAGNAIQPNATPIPPPHYRTLVLSKATTDKLAQVSRSEKTSVTATLQCLLAASLFTCLSAEDCERLHIEGPISIKKFLNVEAQQMTMTIAEYAHLHERVASREPKLKDSAGPSVLQQFSWDTARAVKSTISTEVAKSGVDNPVALLKYISSMQQHFFDKLGKPRKSAAELSSAGVWKHTQSEGVWTVGRMVFSQSPNIVANALKLNVVTGGDGNATLNFCWAEDAVEEQLMRDIIEGVRTGTECLVGRSQE